MRSGEKPLHRSGEKPKSTSSRIDQLQVTSSLFHLRTQSLGSLHLRCHYFNIWLSASPGQRNRELMDYTLAFKCLIWEMVCATKVCILLSRTSHTAPANWKGVGGMGSTWNTWWALQTLLRDHGERGCFEKFVLWESYLRKEPFLPRAPHIATQLQELPINHLYRIPASHSLGTRAKVPKARHQQPSWGTG